MRGEHKGENGKLLIVGGSKDYVGCLSMAGLAALRTGIDLVYIGAPERVAWTLNAYSPDLITIKLPGDVLSPDHFDYLENWIDKSDVILLGNGAGTSKKAGELFEKLASVRKPKVIDADALKLVDCTSAKNCVLTPHAGEFRMAFDTEPKKENILKFSRPDRVIVLKGKIDLIADGRNVYENKTGNSGMTVGGTGDILAGVISGLIAQGFDLLEAARLGTKVTGLAGDMAFEKFGYGLMASDLVNLIPKAMITEKIWTR